MAGIFDWLGDSDLVLRPQTPLLGLPYKDRKGSMNDVLVCILGMEKRNIDFVKSMVNVTFRASTVFLIPSTFSFS